VFVITFVIKLSGAHVTHALYSLKGVNDMRILVVDDELNIRKLLRIVLEQKNHTVIEAEHGEQALKILERDQQFDLVLSDLMMPKMSGTLFIEQVKARYPRLPVLLISAYLNANWAQSAIDNSDAILDKPFTRQHLLDYVARVAKPPVEENASRS
jgi:CheY-like chemotaxis protein